VLGEDGELNLNIGDEILEKLEISKDITTEKETVLK
jgi:hypothetical protein